MKTNIGEYDLKLKKDNTKRNFLTSMLRSRKKHNP